MSDKDVLYAQLATLKTPAKTALQFLIEEDQDNTYYYNQDTNPHLNRLKSWISAQNFSSIMALYDTVAREAFTTVHGEAFADIMGQVAENFIHCNTSFSWTRRSFRTQRIDMLLPRFLTILEHLFDSKWQDFDEEKLIATLKNSFLPDAKQDQDLRSIHSSLMSDMVATSINKGNQTMVDLLASVILSDNNTQIITSTLIAGIAKSGNTKLQGMLSELLLAAKLQEGLRQSILEQADTGTLPFLKQMLGVVIEHNLLRFSSTVRAVSVWMGLYLEADQKRIVEKLATLAHRYLHDPTAQSAGLKSKDTLEIYVALWSIAASEIEHTLPEITRLLESGALYQQQVALYFMRELSLPEFKNHWIRPFLNSDNPKLLPLIHCIYTPTDSVWFGYDQEESLKRIHNLDYFKDKKTRDEDFENLLKQLPLIPKSGLVLSGAPFDWCEYTLSQETIFKTLIVITIYDNDLTKLQRLLEYIEYSDSSNRSTIIKLLLNDLELPWQRNHLFSALKDRGMQVRIDALEKIKTLTLSSDEEDHLIALLSLKTADIREKVIEKFLSETPEKSLTIIERLLKDRVENRRLAALDMLLSLKKADSLDHSMLPNLFALMPKISEKEQVLLDTLQSQAEKAPTRAEGFGFYDPTYRPTLTPLIRHNEAPFTSLRNISKARIDALLQDMICRIEANKDYQFTKRVYRYSTETQVVTLGANNSVDFRADAPCYIIKDYDYQHPDHHAIEQFVLPEVWKGWLEENNVTLEEHFLLAHHTFFNDDEGFPFNRYNESVQSYLRAYFCDYSALPKRDEHFEKTPFLKFAFEIIINLWDQQAQTERFTLLYDLLATAYQEIPQKAWLFEDEFDYYRNYWERSLLEAGSFRNLFHKLQEEARSDAQYLRYLLLNAHFAHYNQLPLISLDIHDIARGFTLGFYDENILYRQLFSKNSYNLRSLSNQIVNSPSYGVKSIEKYPFLKDYVIEVSQFIIDIEIKRGDLPTEVSDLSSKIAYHQGMENFVNILLGLGKDTLSRGWSYGNGGKKESLSGLLAASHPSDTDNAKDLKKLINGRIDDVRLLEAALYAPSWLPIISELLNWKGLESAAWYFHAHINEGLSDEKMAVVARYSPISKEAFVDGAFDIEWFLDAYKTLGKARFEILYDAAKYITSGGNHKRAQYFADATLGKIKATKAFEAEISDKRNKDKFLAYSLVPLGKNSDKTALKRYEFIQKFLKESKKFGAQRQASEAKICDIALQNLARNAGYPDPLIFSWKMETLKLQSMQHYFEGALMDDITLKIAIDAMGLPELILEKAGKILKTVPAKQRKNKMLLDYRERVKELKDQHKRAKATLELAMTRADQFKASDITLLEAHPVIFPLLDKLLFTNGIDKIYTFSMLLAEKEVLDTAETMLMIAHPYHLYQQNAWRHYQHEAFTQALIQPFKQIFRELYLTNDDEKAAKIGSLRYAGHQIQPQKTVALLKTRGWTVDEYRGLQRVYYRENIIATLYAQADWFTPSEIEAPTIEQVTFFDRKTGKELETANISPIIFSEVMRDIDLVVSVAHVGGVDPEASHSTMEMRAAIIGELIPLMKLENVTIAGNFANIKGSLGEYTIHLGSGGVQMMGRGAINIIAVQSQHRGRIFLPFVDEDPRTAEIVSKIVLLSQDQTIKDPTILSQIA